MQGDKSTEGTQEKDLRGRFAALRSEEAAETPEFSLPGSDQVHLRPRRWGTLRVTAAAFLVAMVAALGLRLIPRKPERNVTLVASLTKWKAPTDFLLETPGRELLETVPVIGAWPDSSTISEPGKKRRQVKQVNSQIKRVLP